MRDDTQTDIPAQASEILDRKRPSDELAERVLIAAAVRYPRTMERIDLQASEFYSPLNAMVWTSFRSIHERREPIDAETMRTQFRADGVSIADAIEAIQIGGDTLTIESYVPHYAERVRNAHKRRSIIEACQSLLIDAWDESRPLEEVLAVCESRLSDVQTGRFSNEPISLSEAVASALREVDDIFLNNRRLGTMTGIEAFDREAGGFFRGELAILAARPGIGKTSLALQAGFHAAERGRRVYFASLEMSHVELATKLICSRSGVSNQRIRNGQIEATDTTALLEAAEKISPLTFKIHDWPSIRVYDIRRAARAMRADFVIVDYLQLVTPTEKNLKRYEQVAQLAKDLKAMARELDVPVLALAQLNRAVDASGKEHRPLLSHLRESGDIEQTADMVLLLSRPKAGYTRTEQDHETRKPVVVERWDAELEVAKNRKGAQPVVRLGWRPETTEYYDPSTAHEVAQANPARGDFDAFRGNSNGF